MISDKSSNCGRTSGHENIPDVSARWNVICDKQVGVLQLFCGVRTDKAAVALKAAADDMFAAF